jgi:hypothetical protein
VTGDRVIAAAGLMEEADGIHAVCIDAASGKIIWERSDWSAALTGGSLSGGGQFSLGESLVYKGGMSPPVLIDHESGACRPAFPPVLVEQFRMDRERNWKHTPLKKFLNAWENERGQESGMLGPRLLACGGRFDEVVLAMDKNEKAAGSG